MVQYPAAYCSQSPENWQQNHDYTAQLVTAKHRKPQILYYNDWFDNANIK